MSNYVNPFSDLVKPVNSTHSLGYSSVIDIIRSEKILLSRPGQRCDPSDDVGHSLQDCYERAFQRKVGCRLPWALQIKEVQSVPL